MRHLIDAGDGITVATCIPGDLTPETRDALVRVARAAASWAWPNIPVTPEEDEAWKLKTDSP